MKTSFNYFLIIYNLKKLLTERIIVEYKDSFEYKHSFEVPCIITAEISIEKLKCFSLG